MPATWSRPGSVRGQVRTAMPLFARGGARARARGPEPATPIGTGLDGLDHGLGGGLPAGALTLVAARPRVGATALLVAVALAAARRGERVAYVSERLAERQLRGRLVLLESRVNGYRFSAGLVSAEDRIALAAARERLPWQSLSFLVKREVSAFDVEDHLYGYRPGLLIADLLPRPPAVRAPSDRLAALLAGAGRLAELAAEHQVALVVRWVLARSGGAPAREELPGMGVFADAFDTVLLLHRRDVETAPAAPDDSGKAEAHVIRRGGRDVAGVRVALRFDQRYGGVSEPALGEE